MITSLATRLPSPTQPLLGRPAPARCLPAFRPCRQWLSQGTASGRPLVAAAAAGNSNGKPWQRSPASLPPLPYSVASLDDALASLDGAVPPAALPLAAQPLAPAGEEGAQQSSRAPWWDELSSSESDSEHGLEPWKNDPYWTPDRPGMVRRFLGIGGS